MTSEKMNQVSEEEVKVEPISKSVLTECQSSVIQQGVLTECQSSVIQQGVLTECQQSVLSQPSALNDCQQIVSQQSVESVRKQRFAFTIERDIFLLQTMLSLNPWQFGHQRWAEAVRVFSRRTWEVTQRTLQSRLKVLREQFKKQILTSKTGTEEQKSKRAALLTDIEFMIDAANDGHHILGYCPSVLSDLPPVEVELEESHSTCGTPVGGSNKHTPFAYHIDRQDWEEADKANDQSASEFAAEHCGMRAKRPRLLEESFYIKQAEHEMEMNSRRQTLEEAREKRLLEEGQRRDKLAATQMEIQKQHIQVIVQQQQQQALLVQLISQLSSKRNPNQDH